MGVSAALGAVAVVGSAYSAYSKVQAGKKKREMMERNAGYADWQADDALARGATNERRQRQQTGQVIGAQRTSFAAQNIDVNRGSAMDVQADAAYLGELDALTIRNNAAKEAYGFRIQAEDLRLGGEYAEQEGTMDAIGTILGGGSSLLLAKYGGGPYSGYQGLTAPAATGTTTKVGK